MPFFRPPYGLHDATTVRAVGDAGFAWLVLWNVDPSDYLNPARDELVRRVVKKGAVYATEFFGQVVSAL